VKDYVDAAYSTYINDIISLSEDSATSCIWPNRGGNFNSCPKVLRGCGKCLKVTMQTRAAIFFAPVNGGLSGGSSVHRPGSKDHHLRESNSNYSWSNCNIVQRFGHVH
jgi:hypothetical protein